MNAQPHKSEMNQEIERELARLLDRAQAENRPAEVKIADNLYRLVMVDDIQTTDDPAKDYDPQKVRDAIHAAAGAMKGVNRDELFAALRAERGKASIGRPAE